MGMQSVIQARDEELQQLHKKSSDQLQYIQLLKQQLDDVTNSSDSTSKDSEMKYKVLKSKYQNAKDQIKEMANANDILTEEIEQKKTLIVKYRGIDKELLEYREENENYVTKQETLEN